MAATVPAWRRYLRFWRTDIRADIEEEIAFHLEERVAALVAEGHALEDATRMACEEFGPVDEVRERLTAIDERIAARTRNRGSLDSVAKDLRYAARRLVQAPAFTALVVITLALGVGANAALFSLVDSLFFRLPSGVEEAGDLIRLYQRTPVRVQLEVDPIPTVFPTLSYPAFLDIRNALPAGAGTTFYRDRAVTVGRGEVIDTVRASWIGPRYFELLGVGAPHKGTYLTDDLLEPLSVQPVAVVSYAEWMRRFEGRDSVIGVQIEIGSVAYTIVGVAAPTFRGIDVERVDYWLPIGLASNPPGWAESRTTQQLKVIVRSNAPREQLQVVANDAFRAGASPRDSANRVIAGPIQAARGPLDPTAELRIATRLGGVTLLVLLIAWANVANLMLARAMHRSREIAIRLSLGVSARRLAGLFLMEGLALGVASAVAALLVAYSGGQVLRGMLMPGIVWSSPPLDERVGGFALVLACFTALAASLAPVLRARRDRLGESLTSGSRQGGYAPSRLRAGLVVAQTALSVVLLVAAGVFVQSVRTAEAIDPGYDISRLLQVDLRFDDGRFHAAEKGEILSELRGTLTNLPGVESAALSGRPPMSGYATTSLFREDGTAIWDDTGPPRLTRYDPAPSRGIGPSSLVVSADFFRTSGVEVLQGREFTEDDRASAPPVMIVNKSMADAMWPGGDALGECVRPFTAETPCAEIVGIVEDLARDGLIEELGNPMWFMSVGQGMGEFKTPQVALVRIAPTEKPAKMAELLKANVDLPRGVFLTVTPMESIIGLELRPLVLGAALFTAFGILALIVASLGMYSALSFAVSQRTREMGVRIALGSRASEVVTLVLGDGLRQVGVGLVVGVFLSVAAGRLIASLLYQTSPRDPVAVASACGLLLAVAVLACLVPALRAARVDPVVALRAE